MLLHILLCVLAWPAASTGLRSNRARIALHKHHSQHQVCLHTCVEHENNRHLHWQPIGHAQDVSYAPVHLNPSSKHNHESNTNRQVCDFERDNIGMTHAAIPTEWWLSYNDEPRLLANWTRRWMVGDIQVFDEDQTMGMLATCVYARVYTGSFHLCGAYQYPHPSRSTWKQFPSTAIPIAAKHMDGALCLPRDQPTSTPCWLPFA